MRTHHLQDRGTWVRSYVGIILWTPFTVWKSNVTRNVSWCATREGSAEKSVRQEDQYILLTLVEAKKIFNLLLNLWFCSITKKWRLSNESFILLETINQKLMIYKNLYKNDLNFIERNKHLILYNPGESINPLQILPILLLCIKHTCSQNEFLPFQPLHHRAATGKTKELSKDARDITVDLHKVKRPPVRSSCNFLPIPIISNYLKIDEI